MRTWRTNEVVLASFHVERSFYFELLREVRPWIERAQHLRSCIYLNATNNKLPGKEQRQWMYMYEQMLVDRMGPKFRFLPPNPDPQPAKPAPKKEPARARTPEPEPQAKPGGFIRVRE